MNTSLGSNMYDIGLEGCQRNNIWDTLWGHKLELRLKVPTYNPCTCIQSMNISHDIENKFARVIVTTRRWIEKLQKDMILS